MLKRSVELRGTGCVIIVCGCVTTNDPFHMHIVIWSIVNLTILITAVLSKPDPCPWQDKSTNLLQNFRFFFLMREIQKRSITCLSVYDFTYT